MGLQVPEQSFSELRILFLCSTESFMSKTSTCKSVWCFSIFLDALLKTEINFFSMVGQLLM